MAQARVTISDERDRIRAGHPWVFATQVLHVDGDPAPGDVVQVVDTRRNALGQGYINPASMIRVRMLTPHPGERVNKAFIAGRIQRAVQLRQRINAGASCRLVFSEADMLPGLVVDRFQDADKGHVVLVLQFLTLGMERWKDVVVETLQELVKPAGMVLRNDVPIRTKEGLELEKGFIGKACPTQLVIEEAPGVRMHADLLEGQKTGHFLDQVLNHGAMARISRGARVLDCFTHTGGFALHAGRHGAAEVLGLDISAEAVAMAQRNAELNGLAQVRFETANVFDFLTDATRNKGNWDVIVLDPPAFAKSKGALDNAYRGYKEINLRALKSLPSGGFLVTCSCSQHMTPDLFRRMVAEAAHDAGRTLREVFRGGQPPDHPVLWGVPESHYLKCLFLEVW
jgi:23S rRNA (cytosine1962-C5)-methyltransferase